MGLFCALFQLLHFICVSDERNSQVAKGLQGLHFGICGELGLCTCLGSFALCFRFGRRLCKDLADGGEVEHQRQAGADAPAHGPCHPDARAAQSSAAQHNGDAHAQDQVGEGSDHKAHHHAAAAQDAVGDQLDRHHALLHVMGGVDTPNEGNVIVDGKDITRLTDEEMSVFRRRKIGFVFQAYHLIPVLTVEENIKMPILLDHRKPDRDYIDHIIEMLGLKDRRKHLPNQLSGGQQQRAAIARALANRPALILADEPTGALDSKNGNEVITLLQNSVKKLDQTLVLITHNIDLAREANHSPPV